MHCRRSIAHTIAMLSLAILAVAATANAAQTTQVPLTSLATIHKDPSLVGKVIRVHSCFAIPMSDAPGDPMDKFALLYPCGTRFKQDMDDDALRNIIVLAEPAPDATLQSVVGTDWSSNDMEGDFTGMLTRRKIDPGDKEAAYVLVFQSLTHVQARQSPSPGR